VPCPGSICPACPQQRDAESFGGQPELIHQAVAPELLQSRSAAELQTPDRPSSSEGPEECEEGGEEQPGKAFHGDVKRCLEIGMESCARKWASRGQSPCRLHWAPHGDGADKAGLDDLHQMARNGNDNMPRASKLIPAPGISTFKVLGDNHTWIFYRKKKL
jgi:hypothetical protein